MRLIALKCSNYDSEDVSCTQCALHSLEEHNSCYREVKYEMTDILKTEYSEQFDKERKHRIEVSYYKYGPARKNFGEGRVDAVKTAELCLEAFKKDHNTEHLIDAANYMMFRFKYPLPGEHFTPTDSSGSVGTVGTPVNMENDYD